MAVEATVQGRELIHEPWGSRVASPVSSRDQALVSQGPIHTVKASVGPEDFYKFSKI